MDRISRFIAFCVNPVKGKYRGNVVPQMFRQKGTTLQNRSYLIGYFSVVTDGSSSDF